MSIVFQLISSLVVTASPICIVGGEGALSTPKDSNTPMVVDAPDPESKGNQPSAQNNQDSKPQDLDELRASVQALQERIGAFETELQQQADGLGTVSWELSSTMVLQALTGTDQDTSFATGSFDIVLEAPLWEGAVGVVDLEAVGGDGPDGRLPSMGGWNGDAGSGQSADGVDRLGVLEAFIATPLGSDATVLTFGKVDLGGFFDANALANDETAQFLTGSFVNSTAFEAPDPSAGVVLSYLPAASYDVNVAVSSTDNSGEEAFDKVFACAQIAHYTDALGADGEYRAYCWVDGSRENLPGLGISMSQGLTGNVQVFARGAWQGSEESAPDAMMRAWSAGGQVGGFHGEDVLGFAYGESTSRDSGLEVEGTWETYYQHPLSSHMVTSLHVAGMDSPGGNAAQDDASVISLRLQFSF